MIQPAKPIDVDAAARDRSASAERSFKQAFAELGFQYASHLHIKFDTAKIELLQLGGWRNRGWESVYHARGYERWDPSLSELLRSDEPFSWTELPSRRGRLTPLEQRVLDDGARFGLTEGYCIRLSSKDEGLRALVLSGSPGRPLNTVELLSLATAYGAAAARDTAAAHRPKLCETLKARQAECLRWAALGKTSFEIGLILNLSRKTVDEHIENACRALDVSGRIHAVAKAVELGLISCG